MRAGLKRWVARVLLAVLAFTQASIALADCPADRGRLAHALSAEAMVDCESRMVSATEYGPLYANRCVAHCTADLQVSVPAVAIVHGPVPTAVLFVARGDPVFATAAGLEGPPRGTPPLRVLLHSFLI